MYQLFVKITLLAISLGASKSLLANDQLLLDGILEQGALIQGRTVPGSQVFHDDEGISLTPDGHFLLGFPRLAKPTSTLKIILPNKEIINKNLKISKKTYNIQRIDGLPKSKVTPNKEFWQRIKNDIKAVKKARSRFAKEADYLSGFDWPVIGPISGVYGSQRVLNGKPKRPHYGVDIARPDGTPVKAPADGVITLAMPDMFYTGGTIIQDHGYGLSSSFLHLSKISVKVGQKVRKGDIIGAIGSTGRATGPHLDWRMNLLETRINPETIVPAMPNIRK